MLAWPVQLNLLQRQINDIKHLAQSIIWLFVLQMDSQTISSLCVSYALNGIGGWPHYTPSLQHVAAYRKTEKKHKRQRPHPIRFYGL